MSISIFKRLKHLILRSAYKVAGKPDPVFCTDKEYVAIADDVAVGENKSLFTGPMSLRFKYSAIELMSGGISPKFRYRDDIILDFMFKCIREYAGRCGYHIFFYSHSETGVLIGYYPLKERHAIIKEVVESINTEELTSIIFIK